MAKVTIADVARQVLAKSDRAMTAAEITEVILEKKLYQFNTKSPKDIVRSAIERRCEGLNRKNTTNPKYFKKLSEGQYALIKSDKLG